jgi:hypothetical protein
MSIVQCVYCAINQEDRPGYKKNFHFDAASRNGETLLGIVQAIFGTNPAYFGAKDGGDAINTLNRNIIYAMFGDIRVILRDLGQMKLDHMLEEVGRKPIPEQEEEDFRDDRTCTTEQFSKASRAQTWYDSKNWMVLSFNNLQERKTRNKLQNFDSWMQGGQIDSRDFYENIPHVSVQKIISELDQISQFNSIEQMISRERQQSFEGDATDQIVKQDSM